MIKGNKIIIRTVRENDLTELFELTSNFDEFGDYYPYFLWNENNLKEDYNNNNFWKDDYGTMLIENKENKIVGEICFF